MAVVAQWDAEALPIRLGGEFSLGSFVDVWPLNWINIDHDGNGPASLMWDFGSGIKRATCDLYFRTPPFWPKNTNMFLKFTEDELPGSLVGLAYAGEANGGQLRVVGGATVDTIASSPTDLLLPNRWFRYSIAVNFDTQRVRARVYHLHADNSNPLWDSGAMPIDLPTSQTMSRLHIGAVQGSLLLGHARMAHMRCVDTYTTPTRHVSDEYPWSPPLGDYSQVRLMDGGSLIAPEAVYLWDYGGQMIPAVSMLYTDEVVPVDPDPDPVGTVLHTQTFESQTNNQPLSLSAPWSASNNDTTGWVGSTAAAMHGSLGARIDVSDGWSYLNYELPTVADQLLIDFYVNIRTQAGGHLTLFNTQDPSNTTMNAIQVRTGGVVRLRDGSLGIDDSVELVTTGWYRFSIMLTKAEGQYLRIFEGESDTPLIELNGPLSIVDWDVVRFGLIARADGSTVDLDTIRIAEGGWIDPIG